MSSQCYYSTCKWNCCNRNRDCPEDYDPYYWSSDYTQCYYYYNKTTTTSTGGAIAGYVIAGIVAIVIIGIVIWQCQKRKAMEADRLAQAGNTSGGQTIIMQNPPNTYGQPTTYGQTNTYGQPPVPPVYNQAYSQPYVQPYGGGYPQQQGPIIIQS